MNEFVLGSTTNHRASKNEGAEQYCENTVDTVLAIQSFGFMVCSTLCLPFLRKKMLARCINDGCNRPLYSFAEGRLFQFEVVSISLAASDEKSAPFDEKPQRETLHLWLCGQCASTMTVVLEPARGVKLISLEEKNALEERNAGEPKTSSVSLGLPSTKEC